MSPRAKKAKKKTGPKASVKKWDKKATGRAVIERRSNQRRGVLDTFHVFLCLKERGWGKFYLRDISESGFAFEIEGVSEYPMNSVHECHFFINPGLYLPMHFRVAHIGSGHEGLLRVGAHIQFKDAKVKKVFQSFVKLLDDLSVATDLYNHKEL